MRAVTHVGLWRLCAPGLIAPLLCCAHQPDFPANGRPAVETAEQFARLSRPVRAQGGRGVRIAGRLVRAEATSRGFKLLAEWLPFPERPSEGPGGTSPGEGHRFYALFQGMIDEQGLKRGNEIVLTGRVTGQEEFITLQGLHRQVPMLLVECLHVWKTAGTDLREFQTTNPLDLRYPPPLEETYCTPSQL